MYRRTYARVTSPVTLLLLGAWLLICSPTTAIAQDATFCPLLDAEIWADDGQFLGRVSADRFALDSIFNEFGPYGSEFSSTSIFNQFGTYGGSFSASSPFNQFASTPPRLIKGTQFLAFLTVNTTKFPRIDPVALRAWLAQTGGTGCIAVPSPSPTSTKVAPQTPTRTSTRTLTRTLTAVQTPTAIATRTATKPPTATVTTSLTQTRTRTPTFSPTPAHTATRVPTSTRTPTFTETATRIATTTYAVSPRPGSTGTEPATATATPSRTRTPTIDVADTRTATARPTPVLDACYGDCDENGVVSINEIIVGVNLALGAGGAASVECPVFAREGGGAVTIDQLIKAIASSLNGCLVNATASPTPPNATVVSDTPTPTASPSPSRPPTATYTPIIALDITGVWIGPFSDSAFSGDLTLDLQQNGSDVEGDLSSSLGGRSRVSGVLSGHTLTFTVVEVPGDTCPHTLTGSATVDATAREMSGTYSGSDTCYGRRDGGSFALTRLVATVTATRTSGRSEFRDDEARSQGRYPKGRLGRGPSSAASNQYSNIETLTPNAATWLLRYIMSTSQRREGVP